MNSFTMDNRDGSALAGTLANEFSDLLRDAHAKATTVEDTQKLNSLLDAFEEMFVEMRDACRNQRV